MTINKKTPSDELSLNIIDFGRTGISRVDRGDILYSNKNRAEFFSKLAIGSPGDVLSVSTQGLPIWTKSAVLNAGSSSSPSSLALAFGKILVGSSSGFAQATTLTEGPGIKITYDDGVPEVTVEVRQAYVMKRIFLNAG